MTKDQKFRAVEEYVIQNKEKLYRIAYSYVKNKENALDIVQESIYKALRQVESLQNVEYIKTWFYRIIVNTAIDFLRKNKRISVVEDQVLDSHTEINEDDYADLDLQHALDLLPPIYKTIVILKYFEGLTLEEIAQVLGENVNTVKTRLYSGLKKLRVEMQK